MAYPLVFRSSAALAELTAEPPAVPNDSIEALAELTSAWTAQPPVSRVSRRWTSWAGYRRPAALAARVSNRARTPGLRRSAGAVTQPGHTGDLGVTYRSSAAMAALRAGDTDDQPPDSGSRRGSQLERTAGPAAKTDRPTAADHRHEHSAELGQHITSRGATDHSPTRQTAADEPPAGAGRRTPLARHTTGVDRTKRNRGVAARTKVG
jgi:hypothetical protein